MSKHGQICRNKFEIQTKTSNFFKVKFLLLGKFYFYKTKRVSYMMTSSIFEKMNSKGCKIFRRWEQTQKGCYAKKKVFTTMLIALKM